MSIKVSCFSICYQHWSTPKLTTWTHASPYSIYTFRCFMTPYMRVDKWPGWLLNGCQFLLRPAQWGESEDINFSSLTMSSFRKPDKSEHSSYFFLRPVITSLWVLLSSLSVAMTSALMRLPITSKGRILPYKCLLLINYNTIVLKLCNCNSRSYSFDKQQNNMLKHV